ncbi:MAG: TetR family transcriptional regulator [Acidimicrobiia bacterium]
MTAQTTSARVDPSGDDPRYQRLLEATRDASQKGYEAVQMRDLAATTRMSLATIYQFCSSKDDLIAQAHVAWIQRFRADLDRRPARGDTAADRVIDVLSRFTASMERNHELARTVMRALYSPEPSVEVSRIAVSAIYGDVIDHAIGDTVVPHRAVVIETLGHVMNSIMLQWSNGGATAAEGAAALRRTTLLVLPVAGRDPA